MEVLLPLTVFAAVLMFAIAMVRRRDHLSSQQMVLSRMSRPAAEDLEGIDITRQVRTKESALLGNLLSKISLIRRLEENLWQAGLFIKASDALALMLVLGVAGAAAGAVWFGGFGFPSLAAGIATASLPLLYIVWRKRRRL